MTTKQIIPQLKRHKASERAYVWHDGKRVYLGKWGTPEADEAHRRWASELLALGSARPSPGEVLTIVELLAAFTEAHVDRYGPSHWSNYTATIIIIERLYGTLPAEEFGPRALQACRETMTRKGWNRSTINRRVSIARRIFKWGASQELIAGEVWRNLQAVEGLRLGDADVPEPTPRHPVPDVVVEATLGELTPVLSDMVVVQRLIGCRPGELCRMTTSEIDRSKQTWWFRPSRHKTQHRGHEVVYAIPGRAREAITPYLRLHAPDEPVFSPAESERARRSAMREQRVCDANASRGRDEARRAAPKSRIGEQWCPKAYARAIRRAAVRAGVQHWTPYQLRHARATEVTSAFGVEAARTLLGHQSLSTTLLYAERDRELAAKLAEATG